MLTITIPDFGVLRLEHLVLDYNGTLAIDGHLIDGVAARLTALASQVTIHVLTADTFGSVRAAVAGLPVEVAILPADVSQAEAKRDFVAALGPAQTVAIGNGRNDRLMLAEAALGVAVLQREGAAAAALTAADVVAPDILAALDLLSHPLRLIATLRA